MKGSRCLRLATVITAALLVGCQGNLPPDPTDTPQPDTARPKPIAASHESPLVSVTPKAVAMVGRHLADEPAGSKFYLRVRVVPGGCQGFLHKLDLEPTTTTEDYICQSGGVEVVVFKRQIEMLRGAQVDFGEKDGEKGFKVENPNFKGEAARKWLAELEREKDVK